MWAANRRGPGSLGVDAATERERVVPVIERIAGIARCGDLHRLQQARGHAGRRAAGACIVNDVAALRAPGAREWAADAGVGVCLMHMQASRVPCRSIPAIMTW